MWRNLGVRLRLYKHNASRARYHLSLLEGLSKSAHNFPDDRQLAQKETLCPISFARSGTYPDFSICIARDPVLSSQAEWRSGHILKQRREERRAPKRKREKEEQKTCCKMMSDRKFWTVSAHIACNARFSTKRVL